MLQTGILVVITSRNSTMIMPRTAGMPVLRTPFSSSTLPSGCWWLLVLISHVFRYSVSLIKKWFLHLTHPFSFWSVYLFQWKKPDDSWISRFYELFFISSCWSRIIPPRSPSEQPSWYWGKTPQAKISPVKRKQQLFEFEDSACEKEITSSFKPKLSIAMPVTLANSRLLFKTVFI